MNTLDVQFNVSVLTVPSFVQPESFSDWLHHEARALQDLAENNSLIIIRLYLAKRIKIAWERKQLDDVLQGLTSKYPHIFRVEMVVTENDLLPGEIALLQSDADNEISELMKSVEHFQEQQDAWRKLH